MFGRAIAAILDRIGKNPAWLAREMKKSPACISLWIAGKRQPKLDEVKDVADALGVHFCVLLDEAMFQRWMDQVAPDVWTPEYVMMAHQVADLMATMTEEQRKDVIRYAEERVRLRSATQDVPVACRTGS